MKYILYPILAISVVLFVTFIIAPLKFLWHLIWNFEIISFQHATSSVDYDGKRKYLYNCGVKEFIKGLFIYKYGMEEVKQNGQIR